LFIKLVILIVWLAVESKLRLQIQK